MATISQIRGMLLEEALLRLLQTSGYQTVNKANSDPTLKDGHSGLEVMGRGSKHQIDAVADFSITPPFSYPQRLLVEAKCYAETRPVGLPILRNAVGVLKDVGEYWVSRDGLPPKTRYHYNYALFSASGYSANAEQYAYAHDIYLIPLSNSKYIQMIIDSIRALSYTHFGAPQWNSINMEMSVLRRVIRSIIEGQQEYNELGEVVIMERAKELLLNFCYSTREIEGAVLAMIAKRFPVFLVPSPRLQLSDLRDSYQVRIFWDHRSWYLTSADDGSDLFSFDLPIELFKLYANQGILSQSRALDLKKDFLREIQAILVVGNNIKVIQFQLDHDWLNRLMREHPRFREILG